ncbi:MAG: hypothetical protein K2Z80_22290 [Xanthobacteraceae bacterium]|nr:hypothetical protein [Xanthobacteraceae bacterium]
MYARIEGVAVDHAQHVGAVAETHGRSIGCFRRDRFGRLGAAAADRDRREHGAGQKSGGKDRSRQQNAGAAPVFGQ